MLEITADATDRARKNFCVVENKTSEAVHPPSVTPRERREIDPKTRSYYYYICKERSDRAQGSGRTTTTVLTRSLKF